MYSVTLPNFEDLEENKCHQTMLIVMSQIGRKHMQHQPNTARVEREQKATGKKRCWGGRGSNDRL